MNNINISEVLIAAQNPELNIRRKAEETLKTLESTGFSFYISLLCTELTKIDSPQQVIQLAGILLKNAIYSKDPIILLKLKKRWLSMPISIRSEIRKMLLQLLISSKKNTRDTACFVIASISGVEIPAGEWKDLIPNIISMIRGSNIEVKISSFKALGYICEKLPDHLEENRLPILSVIKEHLENSTINDSIKLEATKALYNALVFAGKSFENVEHRELIMKMLLNVNMNSNDETRIAGLDCLCRIAELYYIHLESYISFILNLTNIILTDKTIDHRVKINTIEFWSTTSEVETIRMEEAQESSSNIPVYHYVKNSLPSLIPLLLESMTHQKEITDYEMFDENNINDEASAASACLHLISICVKDYVVDYVLLFIQKNIDNQNWRLKEAAILSFGLILDGPSPAKMNKIVSMGLPKILENCKHTNLCIKDSSTWTVARVCSLMPSCIDNHLLPTLMSTLILGLKENPKVASNFCWAIYNLAENVPKSSSANTLTPYFDTIADAVLTCSLREDANQFNLYSCCYETLNVLMTHCSDLSLNTVKLLLKQFVNRLQMTLSSNSNNSLKISHQALLCGAISSAITVLPKEKVDFKNLMQLFLFVLGSKDKVIYEEALMGCASIAIKIGRDFDNFFPSCKEYILNGLRGELGPMVCEISCGVIGDVSRAIGNLIQPHCDKILEILIINIRNSDVKRGLKPHLITCIGDIAIAINGEFDRYLNHVMEILIQASQFKVADNDTNYENIDFATTLRISIFETYSMILQGLKQDNKSLLFVNFIPSTIGLMNIFVIDNHVKHEDLISSALNCLGDMLDCLEDRIKNESYNEIIKSVLEIGRTRNSSSSSIQKSFDWAVMGFNKVYK